jgi:phage-related protein
MSDVTYSPLRVTSRQTPHLIAGSYQNPAVFSEGSFGGWILFAAASERECLNQACFRPMPSIGVRCHELRIRDESHAWRIIYRPDVDGVLIVDVFDKNQDRTPKNIIDHCKRVLKRYDKARAKSSTQYESA